MDAKTCIILASEPLFRLLKYFSSQTANSQCNRSSYFLKYNSIKKYHNFRTLKTSMNIKLFYVLWQFVVIRTYVIPLPHFKKLKKSESKIISELNLDTPHGIFCFHIFSACEQLTLMVLRKVPSHINKLQFKISLRSLNGILFLSLQHRHCNK